MDKFEYGASMYRLIVVDLSRSTNIKSSGKIVSEMLSFVQGILKVSLFRDQDKEYVMPMIATIFSKHHSKEGVEEETQDMDIDYIMYKPVSRRETIKCLQQAKML